MRKIFFLASVFVFVSVLTFAPRVSSAQSEADTSSFLASIASVIQSLRESVQSLASSMGSAIMSEENEPYDAQIVPVPVPGMTKTLSANRHPIITQVTYPSVADINQEMVMRVWSWDPNGDSYRINVDWGDKSQCADPSDEKSCLSYSQYVAQATTTPIKAVMREFRHRYSAYSSDGRYGVRVSLVDSRGGKADSGEASTGFALLVADVSPRVAFWSGKVNQHIDATSGRWMTDVDGASGADFDNDGIMESVNDYLAYCKKWYKNIVSAEPYKQELITDWRGAGNTGSYERMVTSWKCSQSTTSSVRVITPNGGESLKIGTYYNIRWSDGKFSPSQRYTVYLTNANKGIGIGYGIAGEVTGTTTLRWNVGLVQLGDDSVKLQPGSDYKVQVVAQRVGGDFDDSDQIFSLISGIATTTTSTVNVSGDYPLSSLTINNTASGAVVGRFKVVNNDTRSMTLDSFKIALTGNTNNSLTYQLYASENGASAQDASVLLSTDSDPVPGSLFSYLTATPANRTISGKSWRYLTVRMADVPSPFDSLALSIRQVGDVRYSMGGVSNLTASGLPHLASVTFKGDSSRFEVSGDYPLSPITAGTAAGQVIGRFKLTNNGSSVVVNKFKVAVNSSNATSTGTSTLRYRLYSSENGSSIGDDSILIAEGYLKDGYLFSDGLSATEANRTISSWRYYTIKTASPSLDKSSIALSIRNVGDVTYADGSTIGLVYSRPALATVTFIAP